ncbi:hypothetical protein C4559_02925 [Candidatus Microgenomates bacterium]|nr:MAG: hypothetical protein C4559_02925 [Candidatus Microgenomates bacterium]
MGAPKETFTRPRPDILASPIRELITTGRQPWITRLIATDVYGRKETICILSVPPKGIQPGDEIAPMGGGEALPELLIDGEAEAVSANGEVRGKVFKTRVTERQAEEIEHLISFYQKMINS